MPTNIEIKSRLNNYEATLELVKGLSQSAGTRIDQLDVFFPTPKGRLKLRFLGPDQGQLIYYERTNLQGPKASNYSIFHSTDPTGLQNALSSAYGIRGVVKKVRHLFMVGQTRIHLDRVEALGDFLELEVVLEEGQTLEQGKAIAGDLIKALDIKEADLLSGAYIDLLELKD